MPKQQPKKPGAPKSKLLKLAISPKDQWKQILREVEKHEAPVSVIQKISVKLCDGTVVDIDVAELLADGMDPNDLEQNINEKLHELDEIIDDVNFFINIDHVAKTIQPATDNILKNL
jgi:hypothetical protein